MVSNAAQKIKHHLEQLYDIPFDVDNVQRFQDQWFSVKPHNIEKELFSIDVKFKNRLRLIIEVTPEKYAAFSIKDMAAASLHKKKLFSEYARQLNARKAKTEFYINALPYSVIDPESWPTEWNHYRLRVSRSPVCAEDEDLDEAEVASSWVTIITGMFLSLLDITAIEDTAHLEGGASRIEVNRYERNPINRELCLVANGYNCKICGFDFEAIYGRFGRHFIHVHHIVPVSRMEEAGIIDPVKDLIPVCPNCHAMLHHVDPPLLPEELISIIQQTADNRT